MPTPNLPPGFDFTDPDIYCERLPVEELAELRKVAPIWWNEQPIGKGGFDDGGYWVVSKHKDVKEVRPISMATSSPTTSSASSSCCWRWPAMRPPVTPSRRA
jgi:cholest-4-en-3-one 26-monooxygenase